MDAGSLFILLPLPMKLRLNWTSTPGQSLFPLLNPATIVSQYKCTMNCQPAPACFNGNWNRVITDNRKIALLHLPPNYIKAQKKPAGINCGLVISKGSGPCRLLNLSSYFVPQVQDTQLSGSISGNSPFYQHGNFIMEYFNKSALDGVLSWFGAAFIFQHF